MFDVLIRGGVIVDGTGSPAYRGNVGIVGDRIVKVGKCTGLARRVFDVDGCIVAPGFIDIHSHTDELIFLNPTCESKVTQGVTTEVCGNCGSSAAPRGGCQELGEYYCFLEQLGLEQGWSTTSEFLSMLERIPIAVNFATLVGHGTVRAVAMGFKSVKPSQRELAVMQELVSEAMEAGALGMSSGLAYAPGCYADTEELIFLCRTVAKYKGIYATHIRDEGKGLIDAVAEAIRIGRDAGISVQISHHKACGRRSWGRVKDTLHLIDTARENGLDVWADQYPYEATSTSLHSILPNWVHEGGKAEFLARLQNPTSRSALRTYLIDEAEKGRIWDYGGWRSIRISSVKHEKNRFCEGLSIEQIARVVSKHPADVILDLLLEEEGDVGMVCFVISEKDVAQVISHPAVLIGSDATARATTGSLSLGKPHPRAYGTFPRVLKKYVRQNQILSLEEAIAKMSGHTAKRLGLKNRGLVREGYYADLVVFDAERICDTATFEEPHRYAEGINYVFVNGMAVVEDGRLISSQKHLPGRVLRRQDN